MRRRGSQRRLVTGAWLSAYPDSSSSPRTEAHTGHGSAPVAFSFVLRCSTSLYVGVTRHGRVEISGVRCREVLPIAGRVPHEDAALAVPRRVGVPDTGTPRGLAARGSAPRHDAG